jgi:hydrogenase maturation protease
VTPPRVLVACVGNTLRGDDGFGIAVAAELDGLLPEEADLLETGIGGIGIVHALMDGYDALVIVDAVELHAQPGEVFVLVPQLPDIATPTFDEWLAQLSDMRLAEPSRILRIARAAGVLPENVLVVGCQPETCEDLAESPERTCCCLRARGRRPRSRTGRRGPHDVEFCRNCGPARHATRRKGRSTWTRVT